MDKNKKKKNKAMRAASALFIAAMLTTSVVSGTYAKYVTKDSANETARVAQFGVTVKTEGNLFDTQYTGETVHAESGETNITVHSNNDNKVIAPGTKNEEGLTLSVNGTPEVAVKVQVNAKFTEENKDIFLGTGTYTDMTGKYYDEEETFQLTNDYHPIKWTLKIDGEAIEGCTDVDLTTINNYFGKTENANKFEFAPNDTINKKYQLTWKWDFDGAQTINGNEFSAEIVDKADTVLGDLAVNKELVPTRNGDFSTDIDVEVSITVTQID